MGKRGVYWPLVPHCELDIAADLSFLECVFQRFLLRCKSVKNVKLEGTLKMPLILWMKRLKLGAIM